MLYDREQIEKILPQKTPFVFVDRVVSFDTEKGIDAEFDMNISLPFFAGHFPDEPIMPGALTLEALAQTSGLILAFAAMKPDAEDYGRKYYLAAANVKYIGIARAGKVLQLRARLVKKFGTLVQFGVEASVEGLQTARGTLTLSEEAGAHR